jgi:hypothetical protein
MAVVKGVKEQVHLPLYDCIEVKPGKQLGSVLTSNVLRFFVDVTAKTKLLTNMQAASLLPHWNTFEARALRVVISDLCPQFADTDLKVEFSATFDPAIESSPIEPAQVRQITLEHVNLRKFVDFMRSKSRGVGGPVRATVDELEGLGIAVIVSGISPTDSDVIVLDFAVFKTAQTTGSGNGLLLPPIEQIFAGDGCGTVIGKLIYNTVTTFFVGEKIMIQVPTWFFPAGAGPYSEDGGTVTHGYPNPQATFRFAEPVMIDTQQNFRVELEVPESDVLKDLQRLYGPLFVWVVLDGYMTRDVQ